MARSPRPVTPADLAKVVSVRFDDLDLLAHIDQEAQKENRPRSNMILEMLKESLEARRLRRRSA